MNPSAQTPQQRQDRTKQGLKMSHKKEDKKKKQGRQEGKKEGVNTVGTSSESIVMQLLNVLMLISVTLVGPH